MELKITTSKLHRVVKYPVLLTQAEERKFNQTCMYLRWFWNDMLAFLKMRYAMLRCFNDKVPLVSEFDGTKLLAELRNNAPDMAYMKRVNIYAIRDVSANLLSAYKEATKGKRRFPKFKGKYGNKLESICFGTIAIKDEEIWLGNFLHCRARIWAHKKSDETIQEARLVKTTAGFHIHVLLRKDASAQIPVKNIVGLDVGLKDLIVRSDGQAFNFTAHAAAKLKRLGKRLRMRQRKLSRCQKRSKNRVRCRIKVAKTYAKMTRIREHAMQAIAHNAIQGADMVVIEGFNPKGLTGGKLGHSMHAVAFGKLWSMIRGQCVKAGKTAVEAPSNFASSKTCHACGEKNILLTLADRQWVCKCGVVHHRDWNAAINLMNFGASKLSPTGIVGVKDGTSENLPTERSAGKPAYGMLRHKEGCKSGQNQQWLSCKSVEPLGLNLTVTRGNLNEERKFLTEGDLLQK